MESADRLPPLAGEELGSGKLAAPWRQAPALWAVALAHPGSSVAAFARSNREDRAGSELFQYARQLVRRKRSLGTTE